MADSDHDQAKVTRRTTLQAGAGALLASGVPLFWTSEARANKAMIDATQKWDYPGISLPPREMMEKVAGEWESYGLPPIGELKVPKRT